MEYLIGLLLSLAVAGLLTITGLDRERAFYPTVLIVIAFYYVLFAVMNASGQTLIREIVVASGFLLFAIIGYKKNLWLVAIALVGHGTFDIVHHLLIANPGVPHWWPGFCLVFDVILGGLLAVRLMRRRLALVDQRMHPIIVAKSRGYSLSTIWYLARCRQAKSSRANRSLARITSGLPNHPFSIEGHHQSM